ncbi:MAG: Phosphotransferase enzyme family [Candidatus Parcubacteria bacterium]|jgi:fructosamine-3-kinase
METQGENTSRLILKNEPKLSEHEAQSTFNERRISLVPLVRDFISTHERFKDKEVSITFAHKGVSSLISIIEVDNEKVVLKIPLGGGHSRGEALFLKVWAEAGVKVPHVIEEGVLGEHAYTLMEYVDAPILGETYNKQECIEKGVYVEMGNMLRLMHEPKAEGYGRVIDGKGEYAEFTDLLSGEDLQRRVKYVTDHKLLGDEHGVLSLAFEILTEHVRRENKSSYCHDDFGTYNMFATHPITVFDPNPRFNNRYLDLGRTILLGIAHDGIFSEKLVDSYFEGNPYDQKALHASILLNGYMKFYYWSKVKRFKNIKNVQDYLIKNKHLLITT